jgi:hypothetical protein
MYSLHYSPSIICHRRLAGRGPELPQSLDCAPMAKHKSGSNNIFLHSLQRAAVFGLTFRVFHSFRGSSVLNGFILFALAIFSGFTVLKSLSLMI